MAKTWLVTGTTSGFGADCTVRHSDSGSRQVAAQVSPTAWKESEQADGQG
jgi:hypothetical protein